MRWRLVALAALALTAGCGALAGSGPDTPTLTPAPVPGESPSATTTPDRLAPGLKSQGVVDLGALAEAHRAVATNTSFVWTENSVEARTYGNVSLNTSNHQRIVVENATTYRRDAGMIETRIDGTHRFLFQYNVYADGQTEYRHWVNERGETIYRRRADPSRTGQFATEATNAIRKYLEVPETRVARVTRDGTTYYRVLGTGGQLARYDRMEQYRAVALVRSDGFVKRLDVEFVGYRAGERVNGSYEFTYTQVGSATVEPPAWVARARKATDP